MAKSLRSAGRCSPRSNAAAAVAKISAIAQARNNVTKALADKTFVPGYLPDTEFRR